jgi:20S proteasome alpha/beta subunit
MTTCIAGVCDYWKAIVLATDQAISYEEVTGDSLALKMRALHPNWCALFAGEIGHTSSIFRAAGAALDHEKNESMEKVVTVILDAYRCEYEMRLNSKLAHLSYTIQDFKKEGRGKLGDKLFEEYCRELAKVSLGVSFLVAGFGSAGEPHIFEISDPVERLNHLPLDFWSIGSGSRVALNSLSFHGFNYHMSVGEATYRICEAKFASERCLGVGEKTSVLIMQEEPHPKDDNGFRVRVHEVQDGLLDEIRKNWQRFGIPRIPQGMSKLIEGSLGKNDELMRRVIFL